MKPIDGDANDNDYSNDGDDDMKDGHTQNKFNIYLSTH